ncbi:MAG: response regulator [Candidatus Omnitrophota bacterium]
MSDKTQVLIVDDDLFFADGLSDILSETGYETTVVNSGEDAVKMAEKKVFKIILMDIKLPAMNGVEAYKKIKKIAPETRVILMTAFSIEELIADALKEGAYGVVHKPFDIDRVISMMESAKKDGCLVMVVDDDPNTRETLKDVAESKGCAVVLAKDGPEAIEIVKKRPEAIVFIDMKLPILNGLETYLALKKINPKIVAVMITAYRQEMKDLIEEALRNNAYTCLYKPFDPKKVLAVIEEITKKRG